MDLIIFNDGLYQLLPVTKEIMAGIELMGEINCLDLCDILRIKLTGYAESINLHIMKDGSGDFIGCMCR
jgi:NADP-dependent 3-hydroxy acid dehydrogenase YdfG